MRKIVELSVVAFCLVACSNQEIISIVEEPEAPSGSTNEENTQGASSGMIVDMLPPSNPIQLSESQKDLVSESNDFAFDFYRTIVGTEDTKVSNVISPLSAAYVLGMLNTGAQGRTSEEIIGALGFKGSTKNAINDFFRVLIEQIPSTDTSVTLEFANIVAANLMVDLREEFKNAMQHYYDANAVNLDFSLPVTVDYLNSWCEEKTHGMILEIVKDLPAEAKLLLMNAIFFKAGWMEKFDIKDTQEEGFNNASGKAVLMPMMHRTAAALYGKNDTYSTLCLPFGRGGAWNMYIMLPEEGKNVDDIINGLNSDSWLKNNNLAPTEVDVKIPRFSTESELVLNNAIMKSGAPIIFSDEADFSLISNGKNEFSVNLIKQKTAIEVSEEGAQASAVTVVTVDGSSMPATSKAEFHANRPFVYLIREQSTGIVFFIGTFCG